MLSEHRVGTVLAGEGVATVVQPRDVAVPPLRLSVFGPAIGAERLARLEAAARASRALLAGRVVWNVNSTASGGGVAEMLRVLVGYIRGAGSGRAVGRDRGGSSVLRDHEADP
jgi:hypothetical protein